MVQLEAFLNQLNPFKTLSVNVIDILQIIILAFALYYLTKTVYKTRAWILVKGMIIIGVMYIIVCATNMTALKLIFDSLFGTLMIAIIIMLQPELQRIVELIGTKQLNDFKSLFVRKNEVEKWYSNDTVRQIADACEKMGAEKTGALIVLERGIPLKEYIKSGIDMQSVISSELFINIFEKNTPLHDGAVIIKNDQIASATCYLPLSMNTNVDKALGTRHRAAIGISETTDCVVVVVSEETGSISMCVNGSIDHKLNKQQLVDKLQQNMKKSDTLVIEKRKSKTPIWIKILAPILSVVLWSTVIVVNDPTTTVTIDDIPVSTINTNVLDEINQAYSITSGQTVSIEISGPRSLIEKMTINDFIATADFSEMSKVYAVPIRIKTVPSVTDVTIKNESHVMKLQLEDLVHVEVPIELKIINDYSTDHILKPRELENGFVVVTCPQSIAPTLDKAVIVIDASNKSNNFIAKSIPIIFDKNGANITNNGLSFSQEPVSVTVDVFDVKEVPLKIQLSDPDLKVGAYYTLNDYALETETVKVSATDEILATLTEFTVTLTLDPKGEDVSSAMIDLSKHLPNDVYLAKNQDAQVSVGLDLTKYVKMVLPLAKTDITIVGHDTTLFNAEVIANPTEIVMWCNTSLIDVESITIAMLEPVIKTKQVTAGIYHETITLTEIEGVKVESVLPVSYELAK